MELDDLLPAVEKIRCDPAVSDLRAATYLITYPSIITLASAAGHIDPARLHQVASMAYGWMPRIVRLDPARIPNALVALSQAQAATSKNFTTVGLTDLAECVRSVVGASKVLHFVNPNIFPIWDSKIERFRLRREPPYNHMNQVANYLAYSKEVHTIRKDARFHDFYEQFNDVLGVRLSAIGTVRYQVTEVRAVEAAAFELAGGEPDA